MHNALGQPSSGSPAPKQVEGTGISSYELLIQAVVDYAIYMLDPDGLVVSWNPGAEQIKGFTAQEIIGVHFSRFYTEEEQAAGVPAQALRIAAETGRFSTEAWRRRKDGSRFWAAVVIDPIRRDGALIGYAKITRDMTQQREAQLAVLESERRFRLLVQSVTDYAIFMLDLDGVVSNWNIGAERIKGYAAEEIVGRHFGAFYTKEDQEAGRPQLALDAARRDGRYATEAWRRRKDGTRFWASVVIDAVHDDGRLIGFAKITRDLTERREAQLQLEQSREQLFQAQKMEAVGQLTGGVAHDFNNLMTIVLGGLEAIGRQIPSLDDSPAKIRISRSKDIAVQGVKRASALTSRLLAFSRLQPLTPAGLDANKLVSGIGDLIRSTLGEQVSLETVLAGGLWTTFIDANQLENALLNLAVNARDAMPEGGKLTIETANAALDDAYVAGLTEQVLAGQYVLIAVTDTGTGMDAATLEKVFEPFFTTKAVGKGSGLGLSQVYGFVRQSAGHVRVYSEPGEGTTVKLYLPRHYGTAEPVAAAGNSHVPTAIGEEHILVVEDDEALRNHASDSLRELGYQVITADSGEAALLILRTEQRVDLLFTDVVMTGRTNGRQLADQAVGLRPDLKVLFTTGYTRNAIVHHGRLDPGVHLISKPYSFQALASKVRSRLDEGA